VLKNERVSDFEEQEIDDDERPLSRQHAHQHLKIFALALTVLTTIALVAIFLTPPVDQRLTPMEFTQSGVYAPDPEKPHHVHEALRKGASKTQYLADLLHYDHVENIVEHPPLKSIRNGFATLQPVITPKPIVTKLTINDERFYMLPDGSVFLGGIYLEYGLPDLTSSHTEVRRQGLAQINKDGLALSKHDALSNKLKVTIFTDPDCLSCRALMKNDLSQWDIQHVLWPLIKGGKPYALEHSAQIMAAIRPNRMLESAMADEDIFDEPSSVDTSTYPHEAIENIAKDMHLQGTPSIIAPDGTLIPNTGDIEMMTELLEKHQVSIHERTQK